MKALPKRYDVLSDGLVRKWLDRKEGPVLNVAASIKDGLEDVQSASWFTGSSLMLFALCALEDASDGREAALQEAAASYKAVGDIMSFYPTLGWVVLAAATFILAGATCLSFFRRRRLSKLRTQARVEATYAFNNDGLVCRARIILEAAQAYRAHCARYRLWRVQVDEEVAEPDEDAATRYHEFLTDAHRAITAAAQNFIVVTERAKQAKEIAKTYAISDDAKEGLGALLDELRVDPNIALPESVVNPVATLENDEQLSRVTRELRQLNSVRT
ncbi:MAG: hypothetical protein ABIG71_01755 [Candidatus Uhrbacteria bacterium]